MRRRVKRVFLLVFFGWPLDQPRLQLFELEQHLAGAFFRLFSVDSRRVRKRLTEKAQPGPRLGFK